MYCVLCTLFMPLTKHQTRSPFNFRLIKLFIPFCHTSSSFHSFRLSFQKLFRFYGSSINGKLKKKKLDTKIDFHFQSSSKIQDSTNISSWKQNRWFVVIICIFNTDFRSPERIILLRTMKSEKRVNPKKTLLENVFSTSIWHFVMCVKRTVAGGPSNGLMRIFEKKQETGKKFIGILVRVINFIILCMHMHNHGIYACIEASIEYWCKSILLYIVSKALFLSVPNRIP